MNPRTKKEKMKLLMLFIPCLLLVAVIGVFLLLILNMIKNN